MSGARPSAESLIERADVLRSVGRAGQAIDLLGEARAIDPDNVRLHCVAASCHIELNDGRSAVAAATAALALRPSDEWALRLLAIGHRINGSLAEAEQAAKAAVAVEPRSAQAHRVVADVLRSQGRLDSAGVAISQALDISPNDESVLEAAALIAMAHKRFDFADELLRRQLALSPNAWRAHNNLGVVAMGTGHTIQAARHYLIAVRIRPDAVPTDNLVRAIAMALALAMNAVVTSVGLAAVTTWYWFPGLPRLVTIAEIVGGMGFVVVQYRRAAPSVRTSLQIASVQSLQMVGLATLFLAGPPVAAPRTRGSSIRSRLAEAIGAATLVGGLAVGLLPWHVAEHFALVPLFDCGIALGAFLQDVWLKRTGAR